MATRFLDAIDALQRRLIIVLFFLTLVIVAFQVFNRLIFQWPILWTTDVSVFCFIWLATLSASSAVRSSGHFRVLAFIESIAFIKRRQVAMEMLAQVMMALLSGILAWYGTLFALAGLNEISPGLGLSMVWSYAALPVCGATALVFSIEKLVSLRNSPPAQETPARSGEGDA